MLRILISLVFFLPIAIATDFSDCAENIATLENALYDSGFNLLQLHKTFVPASTLPARFTKVTYSFFNQNDQLDDCNVTYVWAIGGFLFFQPPTVFRLTSLSFYYPNHQVQDFSLRLPYECRALVNVSGGNCSCDGDTHEILDLLTQQLNIYAKYVDPTNLVREITSARAVCDSDLFSDTSSTSSDAKFGFVIICSTVLMPVIMMIVIIIIFKNLLKGIAQSLSTKPSKQANLVALVIVGIYITLGVYMFNILACYVVSTSQHEYGDHIDSSRLTLAITYVTLSLNSLFLFLLIICVLYIFYHNIKLFLGNQAKNSKTNLPLKCISFVIGKENLMHYSRLSVNGVTAVIFPFMLIPPSLSFSSHIGYILIAFLTEPQKCTTVILNFYIMLICLYFTFKFCYRYHSSFNISIKRNTSDDGGNVTAVAIKEGQKNDSNDSELQLKITHDSCDDGASVTPARQSHKTKQCKMCYSSPRDPKHINTQAFCLVFLYSTLIVTILAMIILTFALLPFKSEDLVTYLLNTIHIVVLVLSTQIAFKVFFDVKFDINQFFKTFKQTLLRKDERQTEHSKEFISTVENEESFVKLGGVVAAELTNVIMKLPDKKNSDL